MKWTCLCYLNKVINYSDGESCNYNRMVAYWEYVGPSIRSSWWWQIRLPRLGINLWVCRDDWMAILKWHSLLYFNI